MNKSEILKVTAEHVNPGRVARWQAFGVNLVIGHREGYRITDKDGRELWDVHLNGGTFNLGHRHPALVAALKDAADEYDIGNHHFASEARARFALDLLALAPANLTHVVYASGGSEAVDIAIKSARWATGRRKILSVDKGYHGRTGLSGAVGDDSSARYFLSEDDAHCITVPFNDCKAVDEAFKAHDFAGVIIEPVPATYGFPVPNPDFLMSLRSHCDKQGTLLIADEVQTGLMRSGQMWAIERFGLEADILVTSKGLSAGMYPMAATLLSAPVSGWLRENGWAHVNTYGGAEIGCEVARKALEIYASEETRRNVAALNEQFGTGLGTLAGKYTALAGIRQTGLIIGIETDRADGGQVLMKALFDAGVWAIFASYDPRVLQFKPGLLLTRAEADDILDRLETALRTMERL